MMLIEIKNAHMQKPELKVDEFRIALGELVKLDGPSGVGKSSFLLSLVKLKKIDFSIFKIRDKSYHKLNAREVRHDILYIPQLTGSESTKIVDFLNNFDDLEVNKIIESLKTYDIRNIETKSLDQLSGGERQILNLVIAMELPRKIILCDESFSAIDEKRAAKLIAKLIEWKGNSRAIVYVSHRQTEFDTQVSSTYQISQDADITTLKIL